MDPYRFHIMWRRVNEDEFRDFFQTNDIYEAKDFAMRLHFCLPKYPLRYRRLLQPA